jgi:hypothetical protein
VRTSAGARRPRARSHAQASAASQLSVELCALTTSNCPCASARVMATRPAGRLRPIGSAVTGTRKRGASSTMREPAAASSTTSWPRARMPAASVRMRISWPPQPADASVCATDSGGDAGPTAYPGASAP